MIIFANPGCDHAIPLLYNAFKTPVQNSSELVKLLAAILHCTRVPLCLDPMKSLYSSEVIFSLTNVHLHLPPHLCGTFLALLFQLSWS